MFHAAFKSKLPVRMFSYRPTRCSRDYRDMARSMLESVKLWGTDKLIKSLSIEEKERLFSSKGLVDKAKVDTILDEAQQNWISRMQLSQAMADAAKAKEEAERLEDLRRQLAREQAEKAVEEARERARELAQERWTTQPESSSALAETVVAVVSPEVADAAAVPAHVASVDSPSTEIAEASASPGSAEVAEVADVADVAVSADTHHQVPVLRQSSLLGTPVFSIRPVLFRGGLRDGLSRVRSKPRCTGAWGRCSASCSAARGSGACT